MSTDTDDDIVSVAVRDVPSDDNVVESFATVSLLADAVVGYTIGIISSSFCKKQ